MSGSEGGKGDRYHDIVVLALVPGIVALLLAGSLILSHLNIAPPALSDALAILATLLGGISRIVWGIRDIAKFKITVNVFVTVALIATVAVGEFQSAAFVVFIMTVAGALESYTLDKTHRSIRDLLDLTPRTVTVRRDGEEVSLSLEDVKTGDIVIVRPGERIPVDGKVVAGESSVNQAPITGESLPVEKKKGKVVFSGTLNETGRLEIETTKTGEDTTLAQIIHLVEKAQATKAPIQNLADRFTAWFLPVVSLIAIAGFFFSGKVQVAVSILLVACPCAFAIATPTAVTAGISVLASRAVLIKGGIFFELAGRLHTLLIDKTGTFTFGKPRVIDVVSLNGMAKEEVFMAAAVAEKYSEHPLAGAVMTFARNQGLDVPDPETFGIEAGRGITAQWNGRKVLVGKRDFLCGKGVAFTKEIEKSIEETENAGTSILVAINGEIAGLIAVADEIRPETPRSIAALKAMGIKNITMLTGDNPRISKSVAERIGVDAFEPSLLPDQKQLIVKDLRAKDLVVGMIGDGINDAPALALADIGIAMGAGGTDVAIETADVILKNDDLSKVVDFIWMSRRVLRRIKLNIFFSIIYNAIGLVLAFLGMLNPIAAVIFQEAGCISVVLSSTLLLWTKFR